MNEFLASLAKHRPFLVAFARRLGASHADAQDCVQVAMMRAWRNREKFKGTDMDVELLAWLVAITRNHYYDSCRRKSVRHKYLQLAGIELSCGCRGEEAHEAERIMQAIDTLPEAYRVAITAYLLGSEYQQIAEKLGIELGTVKSRISRARELLSQ